MIRYRFLFLIGFLLSAFSVGIYGQVNKLTRMDSFSQESILIDFEGHTDGARARTLFSAWGTVFFAGASTQPIIRYLPPGNIFFTDGPFHVLRNEVRAGSPSNGPLIIDFRYPVRRAGFQLENGTGNTKAIIKAFDALGNTLGTVEQDGLEGEPFVGIEEVTANPGIFKLTVDYGNGGPDEQIDDLIIDYESRPAFTTYLAQIADGPLPSGALQTTIIVSNLTNTTARGELRLIDDGALPLSFEMNGIPGSTFDLVIPPFSSRSFTSGGNTLPPTPGYACIQSTVPVEGTAIFRVLDAQGNVTSEAGVGASAGRMTVVGAVQRFASGNFNSGSSSCEHLRPEHHGENPPVRPVGNTGRHKLGRPEPRPRKTRGEVSP